MEGGSDQVPGKKIGGNASLLAPTKRDTAKLHSSQVIIQSPAPSRAHRRTRIAVLLAITIASASACRPANPVPVEDDGAPMMSLLGDTLALPLFDDETMTRLNADAVAAAESLDTNPTADNFVWLGRRLGYLWRYNPAIAVFTNGIGAYPDYAPLYRHRGHRYISIRQFDLADRDLTRAAELIAGTADEVEQDGAPNRLNIPRGTLHFNVWYHLGLARYLKGDFAGAIEAFSNARNVSRNDDTLVAATDWLYMSLRRNDLHDNAQQLLDDITDDMDIIENESYHRRLLMYKGVIPTDSLLDTSNAEALDLATQGYGVANWHLYNGDTERANELFRQVVAGDYWPAFGYIAAEAELARDAG